VLFFVFLSHGDTVKTIATLTTLAVILWVAIGGIPSAAAPPANEQITRGKYIVEEVARCGDCHSTHNEKGEAIPGKELRGATLDFKPITPMPIWADKAPNIAGLRGWEVADAVKFFMTGIAYNDLPARPPMPQYKMNRQDAEAVTAYLKSLTPRAKTN
jgi:mono/diheme cytochrome c family protein